MRVDGRDAFSLRPIKVELDYNKYSEGSVLISFGDTRVLCTASVEEKIPPFLRGAGQGWVTAEYSMLPRSTEIRNVREVNKGHLSGRTQEIQRLIGRSLRAVVDMEVLGERTIILDCDVIQADGGTRTASINGAFMALVLAVDKLIKNGVLMCSPLKDFLAAISVGILDGEVILDLNYKEDSMADVDMNIVATGSGHYVEVQGTGEGKSFSENQLYELLEVAKIGINDVVQFQLQELKKRLKLGDLFPSVEWLKEK